MSAPAFKPSEGKREEFRKYLEKNGVMDALTKVLVNLYEEPEKPDDALQYIRDKLAVQAGLETLGQMKGKQEELQARIDALEEELQQLHAAAEVPQEGGEDAPPAGEGTEQLTENPPEEGDVPAEQAQPPAENAE